MRSLLILAGSGQLSRPTYKLVGLLISQGSHASLTPAIPIMNPLSESTDPLSRLKQSDRNRLDRPSAALAGKCTPWKYGAFRDWVLGL